MPVPAAIASSGETQARVTEFQRFRRVFFGRKVVIFGFVVILVLIITAIFAPLLAPYNPYGQDLAHALQHPNASTGWVLMKSGGMC